MLLTMLHTAPVALAPVAIFLVVLLSFDSYKLVSLPETAFTLVAGAVLCAVAYFANGELLTLTKLDFPSYARFVGPVVEETLKATAIVWLILRNRIGFMIDAAIMGFAVGTGFAVVENLFYLSTFPDANMATWVIRGFGTALMHGGGTALFAILSQAVAARAAKDRVPVPGQVLGGLNLLIFLHGLFAAMLLRLLASVAVHSIYNFFAPEPVVAAVAVLLILPTALYFVISKSENKVHSWLLHDYETHEHLLADIQSGAFKNSEAGRFITAMAAKLGPEQAADMFAYIRVHTELSLRADAVDLSREKKEKLPILDSDRENFRKLHALEQKIGRTTMMMLWPHMHFSRKELWELNEFEQEVREGN